MLPQNLQRGAFLVVIAVVPVLVLGCSFLDSSASVSKSISSPFTSSSRSSSPEEAYREDVRDFTAAHVQSGGKVEGLRRGISDLAAKHGISDWENSSVTFRGIGEGLATAGYRQVQVDAFKENLASTPEQAEWIQKGYDAAR